MNPARLRALAPALASLALIGPACGRVSLDQPLDGEDGQGGAPSIGGQSGAGSSSAGGNKGAGGASGVGGAAGVGGATATVPCNKLGVELTCIERGCRADYCPNCPTRRFVGCATPGDPMPACGPAPPCFPTDCIVANSLAACQAVGHCHAVFGSLLPSGMCADPTTCLSFAGCVDGLFTPCPSAPPPPRCGLPPPSCSPGYVPSLSGPCYEGCVPKDECALPIPP